MEEKKKSTGLAVLIALLVLIILGLTGFVVHDKVLKKDKIESNITDISSNEETKCGELVKNTGFEIQYFDDDKIANFVMDNFEYKNKNLIADTNKRLDLLNSYLYNKDVKIMDDGIIQKTPYVFEEDYKEMYAVIYGDNYNYEQDVSNADGVVYDKCGDFDELKGKGYVCWNGTRSSGYDIVSHNMDKMTFNNNEVQIEGTVTYHPIDSYNRKEVNFEINYKIKDNKAYLYSIIVK